MATGDSIRIVKLTEAYCQGVEDLQHAAYPTLAPHEKINAQQARQQLSLFPSGQTVAIDTEESNKVVGMNSGLLINFDFESEADLSHSFQAVTGNLTFTTHNPSGEYYYGSDICVHPDYRRRGIGRQLYESRKDVCRALNKKGILAGGMLVGFHRYKDAMGVDQYVEEVVAGHIIDPTVTFQLKCGFVVKGILKDYIEDESCCNCAALIYWENKEAQDV